MSLLLKPGARLHGLCPQMALAAAVVAGVLAEAGYDAIVTSGSDSTHAERSGHYRGHALDFRSRHVGSDTEKRALGREIKARLGSEDFTFILEGLGSDNEHWHCQWWPKKP